MSRYKNWTTRDGRKIPINKMGTVHLKNAMACMRRHLQGVIMIASEHLTGEIAREQLDDAIRDIEDDEYSNSYPEIYYDMEELVRKREEAT